MMIKMTKELKVKTYALINKKTNVVESWIVGDGSSSVNFGEEITAVEVQEGMFLNTEFT